MVDPVTGARDEIENEIDHERARVLTSRAWDGELTAAERKVLLAHLAACAECAAAAGRMRAFLDMLDASMKSSAE